ncbi:MULTISPECIES: extracellular solute-binding protein [unclassified Microbacterium]|uniref:ABC transporter substrate-binding protein n=1 Tax=unclassified Microbacterium TaxID=2609290 RepID=UPI00214AB21D|nr:MULTISPECIES: extracellular solute-binding protein [unclassified Microbacterium]MCR2783492.1 extracellular solute-binding protein [Microbacterium sp. zg.B96]WIM15646.1 extracellular solute-binding protein [Microbacterium sp. zg-B96]
MKRKFAAATAVAVMASLTLAGCSGEAEPAVTTEEGPVTLTLSGWSLATTPEFQVLADAFHEKNPDVTVELKEYDSAEYNTLVTADLAAGVGPDIITQKEVKFVTTFQEGGQLLDVSDVELPDGVGGASSYEIDDKAYGVPYRQDRWVLFYNKALFDTAGVDYPDGSWTWDDYADAAAAISESGTAKGAYQHRWQSTVQGFASAQEGTDVLSGEFGYFADYYDRVLDMQDAGAQIDFNTSSANQLTYQGEFGMQKAAMLPMGTWYTATLIAQQAAGEADTFEWGIAPIPQADAKTTGTDNTPLTFGDPTGLSINAGIDEGKVEAAKEFLAFAASLEAAELLAEIGITPAVADETVTEAYFAVEGAPTDDLSKFAWSTGEVAPENPTSNKTATIQNILLDMHTAILSGSTPVEQAIKDAEARFENEVQVD